MHFLLLLLIYHYILNVYNVVSLFNHHFCLNVVVHASNSSIPDIEAGGLAVNPQ